MSYKNKKDKTEYDKLRYIKNKESVNEYYKEYYQNNKDSINKKSKEYYQNNKDKCKYTKKPLSDKRKEYLKNYRINNKNKRNEYVKMRNINDPHFKLINNIRSMITNRIKLMGYKKNSKTSIILGCSFEEFKLHLEKQFESWMNWDNYGNPKDGIFEPNKTWDIDHIVPVTSGKTEEEIIKLNHYTNLKPLCSYINRWVKRNK